MPYRGGRALRKRAAGSEKTQVRGEAASRRGIVSPAPLPPFDKVATAGLGFAENGRWHPPAAYAARAAAALGRPPEGAGARQAPERGDQGQPHLHVVPGAVSFSGHLGPACPHLRCLGVRSLLVGRGLDARVRRQLRVGGRSLPEDRPPERHRAGDADGRRLRQGLWLVAEERLVQISIEQLTVMTRLLRFARYDSRCPCHCEERSDEAISIR
jgi:hypothetical protein